MKRLREKDVERDEDDSADESDVEERPAKRRSFEQADRRIETGEGLIVDQYFRELLKAYENYFDEAGVTNEDYSMTPEEEAETYLITEGRRMAGLDKIKHVKVNPRERATTKPPTEIFDAGDGVDRDEIAADMEEDLERKPTEAEVDKAFKSEIESRYTAHVKAEGAQEWDERELKPWNELSLQGTVGEYYARNQLEAAGHATLNLNAVALNFDGLDNISSHPEFPFEQTKLHLAGGTASVETYLKHLASAKKYAIGAVRAMAKHVDKLKAEVANNPKFADHEVLNDALDAVAALVEESGKNIKDDDLIDGSDAHKIVAKAMMFSVPSDIYDKIDMQQRTRFLSLGKTVDELRTFMQTNMEGDYEKKQPRKTSDEQDDDYEDV